MRVAALENANRFELVDRLDPSPEPRDLMSAPDDLKVVVDPSL